MTSAKFRPLAVQIELRLGQLPEQTTVPVRALRRTFSRQVAAEDPELVIQLALSLISVSW